MNKRAEFSKATKLEAFQRANGFCECGCGQKLMTRAEYDHIVPAALGGTNSLDNCMVLDRRCHRLKTSKTDVPQIAKSQRIYEKHAGIRKSSRPFPKRPAAYDPWSRSMKETE
jgi:5-methylcytosine-specific restriction endonuclease McrA